MNFFWHTPLGMIYFIILSLVCLFAIWRGGREYRLLGYCVLGVFLADRTLLATMSNEAVMIGLGAVAEFSALMAIVALASRTMTAGAVGFLFLAKMCVYLGLLSGYITFSTMAAWTELFGYLQLLVIGGGTIADSGKRRNHSADIPSGFTRHMGFVKSWISPK